MHLPDQVKRAILSGRLITVTQRARACELATREARMRDALSEMRDEADVRELAKSVRELSALVGDLKARLPVTV